MNKKKTILGGVIGVIAILVALFFGVNINPSGDATKAGQQFVDLNGQPLTTNNLVNMLNPTAQTVYVTKSGKRYHTSECRYVLGKSISMTRQEAIDEGYTPCRRCKPDQNIGNWQPTSSPKTDKTTDKKPDQDYEGDYIPE